MRCVCGNIQQIFRNVCILLHLVGVEQKGNIYPYMVLVSIHGAPYSSSHSIKRFPHNLVPFSMVKDFICLCWPMGHAAAQPSLDYLIYYSSPSYSHIFSAPSLKATCLKPPLARNPLPFQTNANPLTSTSSSRGRQIGMDWDGVGGAGGHHGLIPHLELVSPRPLSML